MDITKNDILTSTRMFNQQQIQKNQASVAQQRLRQEVAQHSSPEGSAIVKPRQHAALSSMQSRYMFAIGDDGKRILRLQIDLSPSTLNVLA